MTPSTLSANESSDVPNLDNYPLRIAYDAQAVIAPDQHIGKAAHLLNLLGPYISQFVGIAPAGKQRSVLPIRQRGKSGYLIWQQTTLPCMLFSEKPDFFVAPFNTAPLFLPKRTKLLLVVHDLITFEKYRNVGIRFRLLLRYWRHLTAISVRRAFLVITVSEYSRAQIVRRFPEAKIVVLPNSLPESWFIRANILSVRERDNYLLMVSGMSPHKNLRRGLEAYSAYISGAGAKSADLRVVGISRANATSLQSFLRELGIEDKVQFLPYLSELEIQKLYRRAKALFIPSLMEGFGIPVLEAMASGTPVISSSATSLPEVGGAAPQYCDPQNVRSMCDGIATVLGNDSLWTSMAQRGLAQVEIYHPTCVQKQMRRFWNDLASVGVGS
jgi:glycosyltransferase involved in cell wall biosynthesis